MRRVSCWRVEEVVDYLQPFVDDFFRGQLTVLENQLLNLYVMRLQLIRRVTCLAGLDQDLDVVPFQVLAWESSLEAVDGLYLP